MVSQFIILFQNLRKSLSMPQPEVDVKETFSTTLREPHQKMLAVLDFTKSTIDQVIEKVLDMDRLWNSNNMSMEALQKALLTKEELRFRQVVQCTTCLNPEHSTLECRMPTHCSLCHSRAHTMDRYEYRLLNRPVALIIRFEPKEGRSSDDNRFQQDEQFWRDEEYRPEERFRYAERF